MKKLITLLLIGLGGACNASAATWYGFTSNNTKSSFYFFDWDTINKRPGAVSIWVKAVYNPYVPQDDGIHATADKYIFDCKKRTFQSLIQVQYDKNERHIKTLNNLSPAHEPVPGSIAEGLWEVICMTDFPNRKSTRYVPVGDNDVFAATKRLFEPSNDPAPK